MAYSRLLKIAQDYGLGFQTLNQAVAALDSLLSAFSAEHGTNDGGQWEARTGRHHAITIPKLVGIGRFRYSLTSNAAGQTFLDWNWPPNGGVNEMSKFTCWVRVDRGLYQVLPNGLIGFEGFSFVKATPLVNNAFDYIYDGNIYRFVETRYISSALSGTPGAYFYCYQKNPVSGFFELNDFDFSFSMYRLTA